jgi:hypothetical protein
MARKPSSKTASGVSAVARARRKTATRRRSPAARSAAGGAVELMQPTAAMLEAPARLAAVWNQFVEQMQRAGEQTLQGLKHDAEVEGEALQHASTPQQILGLPLGFAAEQAARCAQLSTQVAASLFDVQAAWFKDLEAMATQLMSPWFTRDGRIAFGCAQDLVEPPADEGPAPLLWSAQRIWTESAKVWLHAMSHDVQSETTAAR